MKDRKWIWGCSRNELEETGKINMVQDGESVSFLMTYCVIFYCGVSILGDVQKLSRYGARQADLGVSA